MLLITAIFFVKIAQAIPGVGLGFGGGTPPPTSALFYKWMAGMLCFDVFVLVTDWMKSGLLKTQGLKELRVYWIWIALNSILASICYWAAFPPSFMSVSSVEAVAIGVFACALMRTILHYSFGKNFMFP